jgi:hypothetical protein
MALVAKARQWIHACVRLPKEGDLIELMVKRCLRGNVPHLSLANAIEMRDRGECH